MFREERNSGLGGSERVVVGVIMVGPRGQHKRSGIIQFTRVVGVSWGLRVQICFQVGQSELYQGT